MADSGTPGDEVVDGAPPVIPEAEQREQRLVENIQINQYLMEQVRALEILLLEAVDLPALFEVLLVDLPRHLDLRHPKI